jgi:hypothetical protein
MLAVLMAAALGAGGAAPASDFSAALQVRSPGGKATGVEIDAGGVSSRLARRPVLRVKVGQRLRATWKVTCTAKGKIANMLVHFYVAGEKAAGQKEAPDLRKPNVAVESAVTMDFDPKDQASATMPFALDAPGAYRVQVETLDQGPKHEHEHAATLDIVVEGGGP